MSNNGVKIGLKNARAKRLGKAQRVDIIFDIGIHEEKEESLHKKFFCYFDDCRQTSEPRNFTILKPGSL